MRSLKLQLRLLDRDGALVDSKEILLAYQGGPALLPGESRARALTTQLPPSYDRFVLAVLEIE